MGGDSREKEKTPVEALLESTFEALAEEIALGRESLENSVKKLLVEVSGAGSSSGLVSELVNSLDLFKNQLLEAREGSANKIDEILSKLPDPRQIASKVEELKAKNVDLLKKIGETLDESFTKSTDMVDTRQKSLEELVGASSSVIDSMFKKLGDESAKFLPLLEKVSMIFEDSSNVIQGDLFSRMAEYVPKKNQELVEDIVTLVVEEHIEKKREVFEEEVASQIRQFLDFLGTSFREEVVTVLREILGSFKQGFEDDFCEAFLEVQRGAMEAFQSQFGAPFRASFEEFAKSLSPGEGQAGDVAGELRAHLNTFQDWVATALEDVLEKVRTSEVALAEAEKSRFETFGGEILGVLGEFTGNLAGKIEEVKTGTLNMLSELVIPAPPPTPEPAAPPTPEPAAPPTPEPA
ncbi:MAG: hypothetical protein ACTSU5_03375, partial [Promethearchaeota archaeon]